MPEHCKNEGRCIDFAFAPSEWRLNGICHLCGCDGDTRSRSCTNEREMWTTDELIAHEKYAADAEHTKVLKEFLHKARKKRTHDDDGICPYDSCVLCEIKDELGEQK